MEPGSGIAKCDLASTDGAAFLYTGFDTRYFKSTLSHFCKALNIS